MEVMLFFPLLGILIGLSAARTKGMSTAEGVIGGLLLGPFAIFMFLCSGHKRRCKNCNNMIDKKATICCFCGKNPDGIKKTAQQKQETLNTTSRIPCPFCYELILENSKKCRFCGEFINSSPQNTKVSNIPPKIVTNKPTEQEIKISCPYCNQHLIVETKYSGYDLPCPSCQKSFHFDIEAIKR